MSSDIEAASRKIGPDLHGDHVPSTLLVYPWVFFPPGLLGEKGQL